MSTTQKPLITGATGSDLSLRAHDAWPNNMPLAVGIALVGPFTGVSSAAKPTTILDWTSVNGIKFVANQPHPASWRAIERVHVSQLQLPDVKTLKNHSGLTWQQLADAMGVNPRTLHLWAAGGGVTASHEERLGDLSRLVDSLYTGSPDVVRAELVSGAPADRSLLDLLRTGVAPSDIAALAPWRARARQAMTANVLAASSDGIVDEDYLFLLYLDRDGVRRFADRASALLGDPAIARQTWESFIDAQFTAIEQPAHTAELLDDDYDDQSGEVAPLFDPLELGVPLGVGAISTRGLLASD